MQWSYHGHMKCRAALFTILGAVALVAVTATAVAKTEPPQKKGTSTARATHLPTTGTSTSLPPPSSTTSPAVTSTTETSVPSSAAGLTNTREVLSPATTAPVGDECALTLTYDEDGNVTPLTCPDGGVNVWAWEHYNRVATVMALGRDVSVSAITQAMCFDYGHGLGTNPLTISASQLAAAYYGWSSSTENSAVQAFMSENADQRCITSS